MWVNNIHTNRIQSGWQEVNRTELNSFPESSTFIPKALITCLHIKLHLSLWSLNVLGLLFFPTSSSPSFYFLLVHLRTSFLELLSKHEIYNFPAIFLCDCIVSLKFEFLTNFYEFSWDTFKADWVSETRKSLSINLISVENSENLSWIFIQCEV